MSEKKFVIVTDTNADFPEEYLKNHGLGRLCLSFSVNGKTFCADKDVIDEHAFYDQMRAGADVKTMQVNPEQAKSYFEQYLKDGIEVLYLAFSSGLSGSYNSALIAADELKESYPDLRVVVVDTLCASLGQGLLTHYAVTMKESGKSLDEIVSWVEENKLHMSVSDSGWAKFGWGKIYGQWICGAVIAAYDTEKFVPHRMLEVIQRLRAYTFRH